MKDYMVKTMIMISALVLVAAFCFGCGSNDKTGNAKPGKEENIGTENPEKSEENGKENEGTGDEGKMEDANTGTALEVKDSAALSKGVNSFNWAYYDIQDHESNLFYSPLSLAEALSMALYGAGGNTEEELKNVLNISDTDTFLSDLNAFAKADYGSVNKLTIANSLWSDETFAANHGINEDFTKGLEQKLDAEVREADFANDTAKAGKEITDWVKDKTEGFIPDYRSIADENTVLDIINAIYFNGKWETEFMQEDTFQELFRGKDEKSVEMMHLFNESFRYLEKSGFKGAELPYKESTLVMDIVLPENDEDSGIDTGKKWADLSDNEKEEFLSELSMSESQDINIVAVPKFDMDLTAEGLKEDLEKMGIKDAFDPGAADFSGIAEDMYVSDIAHRAKIEVDEEGSRAAAVTEMEMAVTSMGPSEESRYFICDRPFVYVIKDSKTGVILFTGLVNSL